MCQLNHHLKTAAKFLRVNRKLNLLPEHMSYMCSGLEKDHPRPEAKKLGQNVASWPNEHLMSTINVCGFVFKAF